MDIVISEEDGVRLLRFGTAWCQGAMRIDAPDRLELEYAPLMFGWLLLREPQGQIVTLGLGAGSLSRFAQRVLGMQATAVEIDAGVIAACRTHFALPPEVRVVHADGADYVARATPATVAVLQVDAYDASVDAPVLDGKAFHAACRRALRPDGAVALNLIGRGLDVRASVARLRAGLQPRSVWQFPPTQAGNVVVIAHRGEPPDEETLAARAAAIEARWGLAAPAWLRMARRSSR